MLVNFLHKLLGMIKLMSSGEKYPIILAGCIAITMSSFTNDFHKHEKLISDLGRTTAEYWLFFSSLYQECFSVLSTLRHKLLQSMHCLEQEFVVPIFA